MKTCTKCKQAKRDSDFYSDSRARDLLQSRCKVCFQEGKKEWAKKNIHTRRRIAREWSRRNRRQIQNYQNRRTVEDPEFRIRNNLKGRIRSVLRGAIKSGHTIELIGITPAELMVWLELKFQPGMSWDNYGTHGWHVDHKIPCSAFNLTDPAEQRKCFVFTNLQPLWAQDNIIKGHKYQSP